MTVSLVEEILHALVNYVPYIAFIFFIFDPEYKCSEGFLVCMVALSSLLQVIFLIIPHFLTDHSSELLSLALTLGSFVFYLAVIKVDFFQALFRLLMVNNIANIIVVPAKCLEGILFPSYALELSHWTYSLCLAIVQGLILIPTAWCFQRWYPKAEQMLIDSNIWRFLCFVPVVFYVLWYYIFYFSSDIPALSMALRPRTTFFMLFLLLGQLCIYTCILNFAVTYNKLILMKEESNQLNIQIMQYQDFQHQIQDIRAMRHDLRHHITLMCSYADHDKYEELKDYLHSYAEQLHDSQTIVYCNLLPLNMLLVYYSKLCQASNISLDVQLHIPDSLALADNEITVLFGNLLENAYEACSTQNTENKQITFHGLCQQQQVVFTLDNTYDNAILLDSDHHFLSSKHDGNGFGTKSAEHIVKKYHGTIDFQPNEQLFCVSIMLPL